MNKFVLLALVGCSLGILMQTVFSGELSLETAINPADETQTNDFASRQDDFKDEGFEDDLDEEDEDDEENFDEGDYDDDYDDEGEEDR